jgi:hypothetical protein
VIDTGRIIYLCRKHFLRRNKIPLPENQARCLFGIADETGTLKAGECFIQYRHLENSLFSKIYDQVEGRIFTFRNSTTVRILFFL